MGRSGYTVVAQEWVLPTVGMGSTVMMGGEGQASKEGGKCTFHAPHLLRPPNGLHKVVVRRAVEPPLEGSQQVAHHPLGGGATSHGHHLG